MNPVQRRFALPLLASLATGLLLLIAFPQFDRAEAAWAALIPLALVVFHATPRASFAWGYLSGAVFFIGSLYWILHVTVVGWIVLGLFLGLYLAAWSWMICVFHRRIIPTEPTTARNLLLAFLGACAWVALEIVRTHLFTGFPWNLLGVSQYQNLAIIQFATVTGIFGVSWLVCFVNLCLTETILRVKTELRASPTGRRIHRPHLELFAALGLVVCAMITGMRAARPKPLPPATAPQVLSVALVQPNIPQSEKWDEMFEDRIYERLRILTEGAANGRPDLIVWPETATPQPLLYDHKAFEIITNAVRQSGGYLLTGSLALRGPPNAPSEDRVWYNSAYVVTPETKLLGPYHKIHLVPFGEFVPLENTLPFMKKITPIPGSLVRGHDHTLFPIRDSQLGVAICFEDVFPDLCRRFVVEGAQLLVNVTNDAWYKKSAGAYQHMANSVFRAIENRVPLVRCANTGYSCFIDSRGRIVSHIAGGEADGIFVQGFKTEKVRPRHPEESRTFYTRYGDVFAWGCFAVTVVAMAVAFWWRRGSIKPEA